MDIAELVISLTSVWINWISIRSFHLRLINSRFQILTRHTTHLSILAPIRNISSVNVISIAMEVPSFNKFNIISTMDLQLTLKWYQLLRWISSWNYPF